MIDIVWIVATGVLWLAVAAMAEGLDRLAGYGKGDAQAKDRSQPQGVSQ